MNHHLSSKFRLVDRRTEHAGHDRPLPTQSKRPKHACLVTIEHSGQAHPRLADAYHATFLLWIAAARSSMFPAHWRCCQFSGRHGAYRFKASCKSVCDRTRQVKAPKGYDHGDHTHTSRSAAHLKNNGHSAAHCQAGIYRILSLRARIQGRRQQRCRLLV